MFKFIGFSPLITEKLKIFGSVNKQVLCHTGNFTVDNMLLEIMKCINKFANLQNAGISSP